MYNQPRPGQPQYPQNPGYQPQPGYGAPQPGYGAPQPYGAPQQGYGAPQPGYGAPQPGYGSQPAYAQSPYGQPQQQFGQPQNPMATNQGWAMAYLQNVSPQEMHVMQQWFQSVDRDRSGTISAPELAGILFNQRPIGLGVANKLIRVFDKDGSGTIDFREYCALHQFLNAMQNAFFAADRDRSGYIDANEMFTAVQGAGFQLSLPTIQALVNKFSTPGRGVDFPNYLFMCAHLAHLRSIFEWNDTARAGRITLTYDALAHIGTDILPS